MTIEAVHQTWLDAQRYYVHSTKVFKSSDWFNS